jgi:hypothetical protein
MESESRQPEHHFQKCCAKKQFKGKLLPLIIIALKELGESRVTDAIREKFKTLVLESNTEERATMLHDLYLSPA